MDRNTELALAATRVHPAYRQTNRFPRVVLTSLATLLLLGVGACGWLTGSHQRSWSEDVQLDDGSVITIDRFVSFDSSDALGGGAYSATETKATLAFTGNLASLPTWDVPLMPLVLYRDSATKEWVIVATSTRCEIWAQRGKPNPPYWEYRLTSAGWQDHPLSESSTNRSSNLFIRYSKKLERKHFAVEEKKRIASDLTVDDMYRLVGPAIAHFCMS
jgi:hypothetical protein